MLPSRVLIDDSPARFFRVEWSAAAAFVALFSTAAGSLAMSSGGGWVGFSLFAAVGCAFALYALVTDIVNGRFNVFRVTICLTLIWYFGPVLGGALFPTGLATPSNTDADVRAVATIVLSAAIIAPMAAIERFTMRIEYDGLGRSKIALALILISSFLQLILLATGAQTYGLVAENAKLSVFSVGALSVATTPIAAAILGAELKRKGHLRSILASATMCLIVGLIWHFFSGRRTFAVAALLSGIAFLSVFARTMPLTKKTTISLILVVLTVLLISIAWQAFFAIRIASYSVARGMETPSAIEMWRLSRSVDQRVLDRDYAGNIATRGLIINSASNFIEEANGSLHGTGLLYSFSTVVPAVVFPAKRDLERDYPSVESLWSAQLNVSPNDWANTIFLDSYADFGVFGLLLYTTLSWFILSLAIFMPQAHRTIYTISLLSIFLAYENQYSGFLGAARNALLVVVFFAGLGLIAWIWSQKAKPSTSRERTLKPATPTSEWIDARTRR